MVLVSLSSSSVPGGELDVSMCRWPSYSLRDIGCNVRHCAPPMRPGSSRGSHTDSKSIELLDRQLHILSPGNGEAAGAHQVGDALREVVLQLGDVVDGTAGIGSGAQAEAKGQARCP